MKLAKALEKAARGAVGTENVTLYSSDGHEYEMVVTKEVTETEWQTMELPQDKKADPSKLESIKTYNEIKKEVLEKIS